MIRTNYNTLPPILVYTSFVKKASEKFKLSEDECRKKFGTFTIREWKKLLN
jgi:hypothetical protein